MDGLNVLSQKYNFQDNARNLEPVGITLNNEAHITHDSTSVKNYIIQQLDDGNLELFLCDSEDINEAKQKPHSIAVIDLGNEPKQNETFKFDIELETVSGKEFDGRSVEVPAIRTPCKDSVIHHGGSVSASTKKPTPTSQSTVSRHQGSVQSKPERLLLNITIYSCFKCNEQFNSLTLFRQHLKWHKGEKNFNCAKCSAGFNAENNLKIHMVTSHPGHHTDVCPICKIKFQRKASLKSHIMIHQVEEFFTCDECHAEFQNDDELLKHMEIHAVTRVTKTLSDSLVCPYCKLDFKTLTEYKQHIEKHIEVKRSILRGKKVRKKKPKENLGGYKFCKYCGKGFQKGCLLDRHERIHTGERPFACPFCNRAFAQKSTLQIHLGKHTGVKPYACSLCQAKFTQKGNLRAHIEKTHTAPKGNQRIYKCTQCACIFRKVATLNGHITKVHLNQEESETENIFDKVMDGLKMLNNDLGKSALKRDEPKALPPSPPDTTGTGCVRVAESHASGGVRRYVLRQKKIGDVRWYFCNYCSSRFKKPSDLIRHFRTHTLEKPYKCTKCNQAFSLKTTLINHYKIHSTPGCQCVHCDIMFRNSRNFNAHVREKHVKPSIPNYICILCEQVFLSLEEGKRHRSVHEGETDGTRDIIEPILKQPTYQTTYGSLPLKPPKPKVPNTGAESPLERPHHCSICDARYTSLVSLKRHMLYHSGDRKFKCNLCPKAFVTKYRLKEHLNYHKNIRNYGCQTCGKKFVTASLLKRHTLVHNNFKPYSCPYCGKHSKTSLLCRSHIKVVHQLNAYEEKPSKDEKSVEIARNGITKGTDAPDPSVNATKSKEINNFPSKPDDSSRSVLSSSISAEQNSVILSVAPPQNQQESNPGYQMVYLNICDLPTSNSENILNGNSLLSTLKVQNEPLLFNPLNDLQDSTMLFNIDTNKSNMVDPNEVIKSTTTSHYTPSVIRASQNTVIADKALDVATRPRPDYDKLGNSSKDLEEKRTLPNLPSLSADGNVIGAQQGIAIQDLSAVDLGGLPISIIGSEDATALSSNLVNGEMNIASSDMFYDAQVICINCHKMFSDMNVFQKHSCSENPTINVSDNFNLLIPEEDIPNDTLRKDDSGPETTKIKNNNIHFQMVQSNQIDEMLRENLASAKKNHPSQTTSDELCLDRLKRFKNKKSLLKDIEKLEKSKEFRCKECSFVTSLEDRFRKHMNFMHSQAMDKVCKFCFKDFKKQSDLLRHIRTHTGERPFECERCHKKFSLKSTLESHTRTHEVSSVTKICCDVCNSNFTTKSSLKVHMLLHTGARPHACTFCEQTFRTSAIRKAHEKNTHLSKNKQAASKRPKLGSKLLKSLAEEMLDDVNNKKDADLNGISKPTTITESSEIQPAPEAIILNTAPESVTIDPAFLLQHFQNSGIILTTDGDASVPLNLNDITLLDYDALKANTNGASQVSFISDLEKFMPDDPDKILDSSRAEHGQNERAPYVRDVPNDNETLKIEPPAKKQKVVQKVECDICHKLYASKDVLRKHKRNVHGQNKKFPCIKCDKGYDSLEELNKHIVKLHTGYRPYACPYCANSFSEEYSLKTHIKRIHQKSQVAQETTNALLGLQYDLPIVSTDNPLL